MKKLISIITAIIMTVTVCVPLQVYAQAASHSAEAAKANATAAPCAYATLAGVDAPRAYATLAGVAAPRAYATLAAGEADYIKSLAITDGDMAGAIQMTSGDGIVNPYFADFACLGLTSLGRDTDQQTVLNYINWHISHLNTTETDKNGIAGTIYDYKDGAATGDYDSTDSYAATFLTLLDRYSRTWDAGFLKDKSQLTDTLVCAMMSTYVSKIGLTYAVPGYDECLLMDNCEVYQGLKSAAHIYRYYVGDDTKAAAMTRRAASVKSSIIKYYWNSSRQAFRASVGVNGKPDSKLILSRFYADSSSQLYPVICGVISPTNKMAKAAYSAFKANYLRSGVTGRDWAALSVKGSDGYPWCILLNGVTAMGDKTTAARFIRNLKAHYISEGRPYPYYCGEAGQLLMAIS